MGKKEAFLNKDRLLRGITQDGFFKIAVVKTTEVVRAAKKRHNLSLLSTVMLGRALTGVMLLASDLKGEERVKLRIEGDGPIGLLIAEANRVGEIRGYVQHPQAELDYTTQTKLEDGVGKGLLTFSKVLFGKAKPVTGTVELVNGNINEDLAFYLLQSEQVPSALLTDVSIDAQGEVEGAGGILVQALPQAPLDEITQIEENLRAIRDLGSLIAQGNYIDTLMERALTPQPTKELARYPVHFFCRCSKKRFVQALSMLGYDELKEMEDEPQKLVCHYCSEVFHISAEEIQQLARNIQ